MIIGLRIIRFSYSVDAHPSYDLEISCLSATQSFGPIHSSRAMAGECFLKPDDIVFYVVPGVYIRVISSLVMKCCVYWTVSVAQPVSGMATGSPSRDVPILLHTQRVGVTTLTGAL